MFDMGLGMGMMDMGARDMEMGAMDMGMGVGMLGAGQMAMGAMDIGMGERMMEFGGGFGMGGGLVGAEMMRAEMGMGMGTGMGMEMGMGMGMGMGVGMGMTGMGYCPPGCMGACCRPAMMTNPVQTTYVNTRPMYQNQPTAVYQNQTANLAQQNLMQQQQAKMQQERMMQMQQAEQQRIEQQRLEQQRLEQQRLQQQRIEQQRLQQQRMEQLRLQQQRVAMRQQQMKRQKALFQAQTLQKQKLRRLEQQKMLLRKTEQQRLLAANNVNPYQQTIQQAQARQKQQQIQRQIQTQRAELNRLEQQTANMRTVGEERALLANNPNPYGQKLVSNQQQKQLLFFGKVQQLSGSIWQPAVDAQLTAETFMNIRIASITKLKIKAESRIGGTRMIKISTQQQDYFFSVMMQDQAEWMSKLVWAKLASEGITCNMDDRYAGHIEGEIVKKGFFGDWENKFGSIAGCVFKISQALGAAPQKTIHAVPQIWTRFQFFQGAKLVIKMRHAGFKLQVGVPSQRAISWLQGLYYLVK